MSLYSIDFDNSIDRAFDDFIKDLTVTRRSDDASRSKRVRFPTMDVHETENEFLVNAELPGLSKDQINIDVHENTLTIAGETKKDEKYEEGNTHIQERRYGSFSRSISLPPNVKVENITAKFENGILELKLPKSAPFAGKKITIE